MTLADPRKMVAAVMRSRLKPLSRVLPDEWADANRVVLQPSPFPGKWRTARVPYSREWYRSFADPEVRRVLIQCATQLSKTEFLINCLLYTIDQDPYPCLWVHSSTDMARQFMKQRLQPAIKGTHAANRHRSVRAWDTSKQTIHFDTLTLNMVGANSAGALSEKPVGRLFLDERDKYPTQLRGRGAPEAGAVDLAYKRLDSFGSEGKALEASTPTMEHSGIHAEYLKSDQRVYYVPCPKCGHYQPLRFSADGGGGLRWDGGSGRDLTDLDLARLETRVRIEAWYECSACLFRIESHAKSDILAEGVWVAAGQSIEIRPDHHLTEGADNVRLVNGGKPDRRGNQVLLIGEAPKTSTRGYQLSALYSPFQPFGFIAAEFVKTRGQPTQDFVNSRLGEPWRVEQGAHGEAHQLIEQAREVREVLRINSETDADAKAMRFVKGEVPACGLVLLASVDVQQEGCFWLISAMCEGERLALVDWGYSTCPETSPQDEREKWADLDKLLRDRTWPATDGRKLRVHTAAIDSGHRTHEVYRTAARLGTWVVPVKGQVNQAAPSEWTLQAAEAEPARNANRYSQVRVKQPVVASVEMLSLRVDHWKTEAFGRLGRKPPAAGTVLFPDDLESNHALGNELIRHFTAEHRVPIKVRNTVRGWTWTLRPGRRENHWWDCFVYAVAMADALGLARMTRENAQAENPVRVDAVAAPVRPASRIAGLRVG